MSLKNLSCAFALAAVLAVPSLAQVSPPPSAPKDAQAQVPVKLVVLFSSGVGYFEHLGQVQGDGSTELRFKTQQINDILKSLVIQDLDGGAISSIIYPSQDPLSKTLRSFQIDITNNPSLAEILSQLRGAKVKLKLGGADVDGTILGLEKRPKPIGDKQVIEQWVLNLLSGPGAIKSVVLEEIQSLQLEDAQLQQELEKALSALVQARDQDKKPVTIYFAGKGQRQLRIGYVVETPIWKTSYRLMLAAKKEDKNIVQGWAIVENQTDNDWNNVSLSLVSGRPISFIQDLYQPLYIPRPVVQPELYASLNPQTYEGGMNEKAKDMKQFGGDIGGGGGGMGGGGMAGGAPSGRFSRSNRAKAPAEAADRDELALAADAPFGTPGGSATPPPPIDPTKSVASVASASKMGELFEYTVGSVSLPRQRSAMIPIINDEVEVEKLSIYNASVLARNPLIGAKLKNTTKKHLLAGPVTVLDGGYGGDARIDDVPPGQERLLSYGIDLQVLVDAKNNTQSSTIINGKIVKGVMSISRKHQFSQDYVIENKGEADKMVVVEHPRHTGWTLIAPAKADEQTENLYRFKAPVKPGAPSKLTVKEEIVQGESFALLSADPGTLDMYVRTGEIPKEVKEALVKAMQFKQAMVTTQQQMNEKQNQIATITAEQGRLRENMKTVSQNSEYYNRLLKKLNDQETQIEKLQGEQEDLRQKLQQQQKDLADYVNELSVG